MRKGLNRFQPRDGFFRKGGLFPARLRLFFEKRISMRRNILCDKHRKRRDEDDDERDFPIHYQHERERAENRHDAREKLRKAH